MIAVELDFTAYHSSSRQNKHTQKDRYAINETSIVNVQRRFEEVFSSKSFLLFLFDEKTHPNKIRKFLPSAIFPNKITQRPLIKNQLELFFRFYNYNKKFLRNNFHDVSINGSSQNRYGYCSPHFLFPFAIHKQIIDILFIEGRVPMTVTNLKLFPFHTFFPETR